jgi:hypothetical protein
LHPEIGLHQFVAWFYARMDFEGINGNQEGLERPVTTCKIDIVGLYALRMLDEHCYLFDEYTSEVV